MPTQVALKDCPSCGIRIPEPATRCSSCSSELGHCVGCNAWLVAGTECWDCGKSTAVRVKAAAAPAGARGTSRTESVRFDGSPVALTPLLALRFVLFAGFVGALVAALAATPLGPVSRWIGQHLDLPSIPATMPQLWIAAAALLAASGVAGGLLRRYRLSHTELLGKPLQSQGVPGRILVDGLITVLVLGLTAGLGLPWIVARYRRSLYRSYRITARGQATLDFQGTGEDVIGRFFLTLLLLPLAVASAGFLFGVISWIWLKWDHTNMLVPDKVGQNRAPKFTGTFGAYYGRWVVGWFLTLLSVGIYRGWAKCAEWRWVASCTKVA